jgi:hypothetical protein
VPDDIGSQHGRPEPRADASEPCLVARLRKLHPFQERLGCDAAVLLHAAEARIPEPLLNVLPFVLEGRGCVLKLLLIAAEGICLRDKFIESLRQVKVAAHHPGFLQGIERSHHAPSFTGLGELRCLALGHEHRNGRDL